MKIIVVYTGFEKNKQVRKEAFNWMINDRWLVYLDYNDIFGASVHGIQQERFNFVGKVSYGCCQRGW